MNEMNDVVIVDDPALHRLRALLGASLAVISIAVPATTA